MGEPIILSLRDSMPTVQAGDEIAILYALLAVQLTMLTLATLGTNVRGVASTT